MKKISLLILFSLIIITFQIKSDEILILYFSRAGENAEVGEVQEGNTELIANIIQEKLKCNIFKINPKKPYPSSYNETLIRAKNELDKDLRPEIDSPIGNLNQYTVIFLGFPTWYEHLPKILVNQLEFLDMFDHYVFPFNTNEGSGFGKTLEDLKKFTKSKYIKNGFTIKGTEIRKDFNKIKTKILEWVKKSIDFVDNIHDEL